MLFVTVDTKYLQGRNFANIIVFYYQCLKSMYRIIEAQKKRMFSLVQ